MSIDVQIGQNIARARCAAGLSELALAERLSLTLQQLRDVEAGASRIRAKLIHKAAQCLGQDIKWFFELDSAQVTGNPASQAGIEQDNTQPMTVLTMLRANKNLQALCKSVNAAQYAKVKSPKVA